MTHPLGDSFVLWLDREAPPDELRGSLEQVASAQRERFEDADGLVRLLRAARLRPEAPGVLPPAQPDGRRR